MSDRVITNTFHTQNCKLREVMIQLRFKPSFSEAEMFSKNPLDYESVHIHTNFIKQKSRKYSKGRL